MFYDELTVKMISSLRNTYVDNYDELRFGRRSVSWFCRVKDVIRRMMKSVNIYHFDLSHAYFYERLRLCAPYLEGLQYTYEHLANDASRRLLVELIAYRVMGERYVRLSVNTKEYLDLRKKAVSLQTVGDSIDVPSADMRVTLHDLSPVGYPVKAYLTGAMTTFMQEQYAYRNEMLSIAAEDGDTVLDCGACWGGTALYFADKVGRLGFVYSFEFMQFQRSVLQRNMDLNPEYAGRIHVIPHPLWSESGEVLYCSGSGPGARVTTQAMKEECVEYKTVTIDDFFESEGIEKIDFIKMDIEGAELEALKGAENVLKACRPKLAISVYHKLSDFIDIPKYIEGLDLGYEFYLQHTTIYDEETVLFAKCVSR